MRSSAVILAAAVLAAASATWAGVGDLTYLEAVPEDARALETATFNATAQRLSTAEAGSGTTSPKAVVGHFMLGGRSMAAAIDAKTADAKTPDVVRFDLSGEGKFSDQNTFPVRRRDSTPKEMTLLEFGPAVLKVREGDRDIPLVINGSYYRQQNNRYLFMQVQLAAQGQCRFGQKVFAVRVLEGSGNLRLGDQAKVDKRMRRLPTGDRVLIASADGSFKEPRSALLGQLVRVDDAWYRVSMDADAMKVQADPVGVKGGKVRLAHPQWAATFVGQTGCLSLQGGAEPIEVPADEYVIVDYRETAASEGEGGAGTLVRGGQRELYTGKAKRFTVPAGQTVDVAVGSPLKAEVMASVKERAVTFSLAVSDASGTAVDYAMNAKGKRLPEPTLLVEDANGKEVYRCTLEYG